MTRLLASLALGAAAGILDVLPMVVLGTSRFAIASAFLHWLVLGFVITYLRLEVAPWLKGLIIGLASAVPVIASLAETDPASLPPVLVTSAILGAAVGFVVGRWKLLREPAPAGMSRR